MKKIRISEETQAIIFVAIISIVFIYLLLQLLQATNNHEKDKAITRCGGANEIVEHFNKKDGVTYYTCKKEN